MTRTFAGAFSALTLLVMVSQAQAAVTFTTRYQYAAVPASGHGSAIASCQSGELLVGGGFDANSSNVFPLNSMPMNNNKWWVYARNIGSGTKYVYAFAVCASGDSNATSWGISDYVSVPAGYNGFAQPECANGGKAAAGGFYSYSESTDFTAFQSYPDLGNAAKWRTSFYNNTSSAKNFTGLALCVKDLNVNYTIGYHSSGVTIPAGSNGYDYWNCPGGATNTGSGWTSDIYFNDDQWVYSARSAQTYGFVRGHNGDPYSYLHLYSWVKCATPT